MAPMRVLFSAGVAAGLAAASVTGCRTRHEAPRAEQGQPVGAAREAPIAAFPPVRITFTAKDPRALCRVDDCSGTPLVSIRKVGAGKPLVLAPGRGATLCASCRAPASLPPCSPMGVGVERVELDWDGTHYDLSTCGPGTPCAARQPAEPGRYVAELCATESTRTIDSIGAPACVDTGHRVCKELEFDLPGPPVNADL